jgi:hypothetical protein
LKSEYLGLGQIGNRVCVNPKAPKSSFQVTSDTPTLVRHYRTTTFECEFAFISLSIVSGLQLAKSRRYNFQPSCVFIERKLQRGKSATVVACWSEAGRDEIGRYGTTELALTSRFETARSS